jgi:hypothetical protein
MSQKCVVVLAVAEVTSLAQFVSSFVPSKRLGLGTQLLMTSADYGDRYGSAGRFLDDMELYCRNTTDLTVSRTPGIPDPANERDLLMFNSRIAREQLRSGKYPGDILRDIASSFQYLSLALAPYTRSGLKQKKNFSARREVDGYELQLVTRRDHWIRQRVVALQNKGVSFTSASKSVMRELSKSDAFGTVAVTDKQIRNICHLFGIGSFKSLPKKS